LPKLFCVDGDRQKIAKKSATGLDGDADPKKPGGRKRFLENQNQKGACVMSRLTTKGGTEIYYKQWGLDTN